MGILPPVILSLCGLLPSAAGPLTAEDLLLVYNNADADSRILAEHYAAIRGVPRDRFCPLAVLADKEEIGSADYERLIREPVRQYLQQHQLRDRVRCVVTFYGLPIRVGRRPVTAGQRVLLARLRSRIDEPLLRFERNVEQLERLVNPTARPQSAKPPTETDYPNLLIRYAKVREPAFKYAASLPVTAANEQVRRKWLETMQGMEGLSFLVGQLQAAPGQNQAAAAQRLQEMREAVGTADARIKELASNDIESPSRQEMYQLAERHHGLLGLLSVLMNDVHAIQPEETDAAVDNELMLLWWDSYPRFRWIVNTLNWSKRAEAERQFQHFEPPWTLQTLMVSRIDAATPAIARRMIDQAFTAEKTGPAGTVYIDARGLKVNESHGMYDEDLRRLAKLLSSKTSLPVRLDNKPELFQAGQCPNTMLYCGWYSLRKYLDAFTFVPGAVGYHVASFEAANLKDPNEQGWCKRMLDKGITATLGPVAEPYLHSFPPPSEFFGLLLTGQYTLAECYAYTLPANSWMQMLLGDPLYRPFANKPLLTIEQVFEPQSIPKAFRSSATTTAPGGPGSS